MCDDGDLCTDDPECDPEVGCPRPIAKTGFASVTCHLDTIDAALLQATPDQATASARAKITASLRRVRVGVGAAERAGGGKRSVKKTVHNVETALRGADKAINAARRKHQIEESLAGTLVTQVNGALGGAQSLLTSH